MDTPEGLIIRKSSIRPGWLKNKFIRGNVILILILSAVTPVVLSQSKYQQESDSSKVKPINIYISDDHKSVFTLNLISQLWFQWGQMNPGTLGYDGKALNSAADFAIRRMNVAFVGKIHDRINTKLQLSIVNQTFATGGSYNPSRKYNDINPVVYPSDFWVSYVFIPRKLEIGTGLHFNNGVSRLHNGYYHSQVLVDFPLFSYPNGNQTDQAARQLGFFAKGKLARFDYRLGWGKPFLYDETGGKPPPVNRSVAIANQHFNFKGYINYQFLDLEENIGNFTYFGEKKIFTVGAGIDYQPASMASSTVAGTDTVVNYYNRLDLAFDALIELPLPKHGAVDIYTGLYYFDYGPNYYRAASWIPIYTLSDPALTSYPQGPGTNEIAFGTGKIYFISAAYLLPGNILNNTGKLQGFFNYHLKDLDCLKVNLQQYDFGLNYFYFKHMAKITAEYSLRPIYNGTTGDGAKGRVEGYKGLLSIQFQVSI
jgi:hypothetical protein